MPACIHQHASSSEITQTNSAYYLILLELNGISVDVNGLSEICYQMNLGVGAKIRIFFFGVAVLFCSLTDPWNSIHLEKI
jgi:hypothetical protein